jgi:hypothetical protein
MQRIAHGLTAVQVSDEQRVARENARLRLGRRRGTKLAVCVRARGHRHSEPSVACGPSSR